MLGDPKIKEDKPTTKQLPSDSKISQGLHDKVVEANQENTDASRHNFDHAIDEAGKAADKIIDNSTKHK